MFEIHLTHNLKGYIVTTVDREIGHAQSMPPFSDEQSAIEAIGIMRETYNLFGYQVKLIVDKHA